MEPRRPDTSPAIVEASRALCRLAGLDPDAVVSSAYAAPAQWEGFLPQARAVGAVFAERIRALAAEARAEAMQTDNPIKAEQLKARADALYEAAAVCDAQPAGRNVVEFRRR